MFEILLAAALFITFVCFACIVVGARSEHE